MKAQYSIMAPTGLGDIMPEPEVALKSFEIRSRTLNGCNKKAKNFFEDFIKKPENRWDYLRLIRKERGSTYKTIDHTGWPINLT
jgi:hypothetical protein